MTIQTLQPGRRPSRSVPSRLQPHRHASRAGTLTLSLAALLCSFVACASGQRFLPEGVVAADSLSEREIAVLERQELIEQQKRVDLVARRLAAALPQPAGRDSTFQIGLRLADPGSGEEDAVLAEAVGVVSPVRPYVVAVDALGPAAEADVLPGDQILAVGELPVRDLDDVREALERADPQEPVALRLFRDGRQHELELTGHWRPADLEVTVVLDHELVNAFARRRGIYVPTGMLAFVRNEHELAVVLGHEIGHVIGGHLQGSYAQGLGDPRFARDLERQADRFGIELTEAAGYNPAAGIPLWVRFGQTPRRAFSRDWLASHPPSRERVLAARRLAFELRPRQILRAILPRLPLR